MGDVVPIQHARDRRAAPEVTLTDTPTDIRTGELPMRLVDDDGTLRLFPAVVHDVPVEDKAVKDKAGRAFGRMFTSEPLAVSDELAMHMLTAVYGPDTAGRMLREADAGRYVYGEQNRESGYVIQFAGLRQRSSRR